MEKSKRQMMNMPGAAAAGKLPGKLTPLTGTKGWENLRFSTEIAVYLRNGITR